MCNLPHLFFMSKQVSERLYEILAEHLTDRKRQLFEKILNDRTRYLTLVLEDIYQAQNTSAIQRTAESWGVQDLHIIENNHYFKHHQRIAKGAGNWLTMHRYNTALNNSETCFKKLKDEGYQIAVTMLDETSISIYDLDLSKKTAVVLGTELTGASDVALKYADKKVIIPTYGFTESLNVGAAAAVITQTLVERIRREQRSWHLTEEEMLRLKIDWASQTIYWSKHIIEMYESGEIS